MESIKQTHLKKLAESFTPITQNSEVDKSKKLEAAFYKRDSENENQQEIVPIEIVTGDENEIIESTIRTLLNSSKYTQLMRETLGSLMRSKNS